MLKEFDDKNYWYLIATRDLKSKKNLSKDLCPELYNFGRALKSGLTRQEVAAKELYLREVYEDTYGMKSDDGHENFKEYLRRYIKDFFVIGPNGPIAKNQKIVKRRELAKKKRLHRGSEWISEFHYESKIKKRLRKSVKTL